MSTSSRLPRRRGSSERHPALAEALIVSALLLAGIVQCSSDRVDGPSGVVGVTVAPDTATLRGTGDTVRFVATARTAAGDTVRGVTFVWTSGRPNVAQVSATGLVTAVDTGRATISATAPGGAADTALVVVLPALTGSVVVSPTGVSLSGVGSSASLSAEYRDAQGQAVSGKTFTWTSLNPAVATVSSVGVVTAVAPGQATVAATAEGVTGYGLATVAVGETAAVQIFAPMASGTTEFLNAVWGTSATNVFAVGGGGKILHYDGSTWSPQASGTTADLNAVWGTSATDVFAVGIGGTIVHWNGAAWTPLASGSSASVNGVWGTSPVDVYAVGAGALLHWDGTAWSSTVSPTPLELRAIWGSSPSDFYVAALAQPYSSGWTLFHFDGSGSSSGVSSAYGLQSVWGASPAAVFAVGTQLTYAGHGSFNSVPLATRWDGLSWTNDLLSGALPRCVWGSGPINVYAVGDQGSIRRWNGGSWRNATARADASNLKGVWGASAADVFAVGAGGTILRSVPGGTVAVTPASATAPAFGGTVQFTATVRDRTGAQVTGIAFVWTSSDTGVARVDTAGLVAASRAGTAIITATVQGGASASATITVSAAVAVTPDGASLAGVGSSTTLQAVCGASGGSCTGTVTWASFNPAVATVDGAGVVTAVAAGQTTISATANGVTGYALVTVSVPEAAAVTRWTRMVSDTTSFYRGIWGAYATDVYATDDYHGALWHYDVSTWSSVAGMHMGLFGVWGASASDLFVTGYTTHYDGTYTYVYLDEQVGRWNGTAWTWNTVSSTLFGAGGGFSVWGASPRDVFVSRTGNQSVLVFDGLQWAATACQGTPYQCAGSGMWGTSARNVYAASNANTIIRYDGSAWSPMTSALTQYLSGFWGTSATNVFAVGAAGTILHYDGSSWSPMTSGTTVGLSAVWGTSATNVYAVGAGGTILHYDGATWSSMVSGTTAYLYGIWGTTPTTVFVVGTGGTILQGTP